MKMWPKKKCTAFPWYFQMGCDGEETFAPIPEDVQLEALGRGWLISNSPNSQSVPFGSLPPHVSLPLTVNGLIQLLVVLLHGVHVAQVAYTQRDGDQSKSHHWFILYLENKKNKKNKQKHTFVYLQYAFLPVETAKYYTPKC